jgi:hypothetical protein
MSKTGHAGKLEVPHWTLQLVKNDNPQQKICRGNFQAGGENINIIAEKPENPFRD